MIIYKEENFYIEEENSEIPWLKIFTTKNFKELGDMPKDMRLRLWEIYDDVEFIMKSYYNPKKINLASFANMLPRVHLHVMARFSEDSYFPNSMWGEKLRESNLSLPDKKLFYKELVEFLEREK